MSRLRRIGVLGGMGPQATVLLQQRLISGVSASDDASHIPLMIDMNPQVPSRLDWLLKHEGADPGLVLAQMARGLELAGAEALAMPCNTAHHFASAIEQAVTIPLIDMVQASASEVARLAGPGGTVGVLASPATQQIQLFERAFATYDVGIVYPAEMSELLAAIRRIKASGASHPDRDALLRASVDCQRHGAQCLLVGCSEFSLLADTIDTDLPVVDTLDVLVREIYSFAGVADSR